MAAGVEPRIRTKEPAFAAVHAAVTALQPITFDYRRNDGVLAARHVQPWALKNWRGRWYLTGWDVDRQDERAFRLSRFEGAVRKKGRAASYAVPGDHVPEVALRAQEGEPSGTAVVRLRHGRGHTLRAHASAVRELDNRWAEVEVPYRRGTTERDVVALGTHAVAVSPADLVTGVVAALTAAARANENDHATDTDRHQRAQGRRRDRGPHRDHATGRGVPTARSAPAETATQRLGRLLDMVPWLLQHRGVPIGEAASEFGVSEAQIVDDLELLFVCGTPGYGHAELIDAQWDTGHIYLDNAEDIASPMRLTRDEAVTLTAGLQALGASLLNPEIVERTLAKIRAATDGDGTAAADAGQDPARRIALDLDDGSQHDGDGPAQGRLHRRPAGPPDLLRRDP